MNKISAFYHPLGGDEYTTFFPNILYNHLLDNKDNTIITIVRYLLNNARLSTFDLNKFQIKFNFSSSDFKPEEITSDIIFSSSSVFNGLKFGICFYSFSKPVYEKIVNQIEEHKDRLNNNGWDIIDDISIYCDVSGGIKVYKSNDRKAVIVFHLSDLKVKVQQMIATCLPRLFPFAFENNELNDDEKKLLKFIFNKKYDLASKILDEFIKENNFAKKQIEAFINGFCSIDLDAKINENKDKINENRREIDRLIEKIRQLKEQITECNLNVFKYTNGDIDPKSDEAELVNFFAENKCLKILKKYRNTIQIGFNGYISEFDEDCFNSVYPSSCTSSVYRNSKISYEQTKQLLKALFIDNKFKVRAYCSWNINSNWTVEANSGTDMNGNNEMMKDRIPNPHIDYHRCFSEYKLPMNMMASDRNYVGVLGMIITSSSYINWSDSVVIGEFVRDITDESFGKIFEDNDGNKYNLKEVLELI